MAKISLSSGNKIDLKTGQNLRKLVSKNLFEQELAIEQAHIDAVYAQLDIDTKHAKTAAFDSKNIYKSDRLTYVREEDYTSLYERDVFAFQTAKRLAALDAEQEGLVFGRLNLNNGTDYYIGRIGVRDEDYHPLVIDWRAPAAEAFYRATQKNPMQVIRRRVLTCVGNRVTSIEDDLLSNEPNHNLVILGEGALFAALKRARGDHMRDIVTTIQAEQDEAIRAPYRGVTKISGGPGTGKTVVALHRAAYLLYSNRQRFEKGGILVVGPSPIFINYIEKVLPSLGEDSVVLNAVGEVAADVTGIRATRIDDAAAASLKGSLRMVTLIKRIVAEPLMHLPEDQPALQLSYKGNILKLFPRELRSIRKQVLTRNRINLAREYAEEAVVTTLYQQLPEDYELNFDKFRDYIISLASYEMFMNAWWPALEPKSVFARLKNQELLIKLSADIFTPAEQETLLSSLDFPDYSVADNAILDEISARIGPVPVKKSEDLPSYLADLSDIPELVTIADTLSGTAEVDPLADKHRTYAHILVDEGQDITPLQWRMLRRRGMQASWTIVGDLAQSSWPNPEEIDLALAELTGSGPNRTFKLSTNYRSPAEVFDLAKQVILKAWPDADLPIAIRKTGKSPKVFISNSLAPDLVSESQNLLAKVSGTVGVIAPPSLLAEISETLKDINPSRLRVLSALESKGLEYDATLVVAPDLIVAENPGGARVLYVALTRATQELSIMDLESRGNWRKDTDI